MATARREDDTQEATPSTARPRSHEISDKGIATGEDFAKLMSALMSDVLDGRISTDVANAACNAGGKLLKVVEMQYRYGKSQPEERPQFRLIG